MAGQEETIHTDSAAYRCNHLVCKSQCVAQHLGACCCAVGVRVATVELYAFLTYLIRPYAIVEYERPTRSYTPLFLHGQSHCIRSCVCLMMNGCARVCRTYEKCSP